MSESLFQLGSTFFSAIAEFFQLQFPGLNCSIFTVFITVLILDVALSSVFIIFNVTSGDLTIDHESKIQFGGNQSHIKNKRS